MNCEQYRDLLNHYLDGEPAAADALVDHARQCPNCAALFRGAQRLTKACARRPILPPPSHLTDAILCGLRDDRRRRMGLRLRLVTAAVAALLLVAVGVHFLWPQPKDSPVVVVPTQPAPAEAAPTLRDTVNQAGQAFGQLTARTADETVGPTRSLWPVITPAPLDEWDNPPALETSTRPLKETGQSAVVAVEPVTNSARRAFDMLLHDLPPMGKRTKPDF